MNQSAKKEAALTSERLKELLDYDPETGVFTARITKGCALKAGQRAGRVNRAGYRTLRLDNATYFEHRVAIAYTSGDWPKEHTDHVNGDRSDNRLANIRPCTRAENRQNQGKYRTNLSGFPGVCQIPATGRWRAYIRINRKMVHLGVFGDLESAVLARKAAKSELHTFHPEDPQRVGHPYGSAL